MSYNQANFYSNSFPSCPEPEAHNQLFHNNFQSTPSHAFGPSASSSTNNLHNFSVTSDPILTPNLRTGVNNFASNSLWNSNLFQHPAHESFNSASLSGLHRSIDVPPTLPNDHSPVWRGITDPFLYRSEPYGPHPTFPEASSSHSVSNQLPRGDINESSNWMTSLPAMRTEQQLNLSQYAPADQNYWSDLEVLPRVNPSSFEQHGQTDVPIPQNGVTIGLEINNVNRPLYEDAYDDNAATRYNNWNNEVPQTVRTGVAPTSTSRMRRPTYHPYARQPATTTTSSLPPSLSWSVVAPDSVTPTLPTAAPASIFPTPITATSGDSSMFLVSVPNSPQVTTESIEDPEAKPKRVRNPKQLRPIEGLWEYNSKDQKYVCKYNGPAEPEGCGSTASTLRNLARHMRIHSRREFELDIPPQDRVAYNGIPEGLRWKVVSCNVKNKDLEDCEYYRTYKRRWRAKTLDRPEVVKRRHFAYHHATYRASLNDRQLKCIRRCDKPALTIEF